MIKKQSFSAAFTLIELLVVITIIGILASIALPVYSSVQTRGAQTKCLAQSKQIGLALKLYAGDNDGGYPEKGVAPYTNADPQTANDAFALLLPTYLTNESIFYNKLISGSTQPDQVLNPMPGQANDHSKTLSTGENVYGYMSGNTDASNSSNPLVFDSPANTQGTYTNAVGQKGNCWSGTKAILIRLDNSATIESLNVSAPTSAYIKGKTSTGTDCNIFSNQNPSIVAGTNNVLLADLTTGNAN